MRNPNPLVGPLMSKVKPSWLNFAIKWNGRRRCSRTTTLLRIGLAVAVAKVVISGCSLKILHSSVIFRQEGWKLSFYRET